MASVDDLFASFDAEIAELEEKQQDAAPAATAATSNAFSPPAPAAATAAPQQRHATEQQPAQQQQYYSRQQQNSQYQSDALPSSPLKKRKLTSTVITSAPAAAAPTYQQRTYERRPPTQPHATPLAYGQQYDDQYDGSFPRRPREAPAYTRTVTDLQIDQLNAAQQQYEQQLQAAKAGQLQQSASTPSETPTYIQTLPAYNPHQQESKAADDASADQQQPDATTANNSKHVRMAGGEIWNDPTLEEWPENDYRLFVGDLGNDVNDTNLAALFSHYPSLAKCKVIRDKHTSKSRGFGFLSFMEAEDAMHALKHMNGKICVNRPIKLRKSEWRSRDIGEALDRQKQSGVKVVKPRMPKRKQKYHMPG